MPKFEIFRTMDLSYYLCNLDQPFSINNIFISDAPLPCVALYCKNYNRMFTFSINGEKLHDQVLINPKEDAKTIIISCYEMFKDKNFSDNLVSLKNLNHKEYNFFVTLIFIFTYIIVIFGL